MQDKETFVSAVLKIMRFADEDVIATSDIFSATEDGLYEELDDWLGEPGGGQL